MGGPQYSLTSVLKKMKLRTQTHTAGQPCEDKEKTVYLPRGEASGGTSPTSIILDFQPPHYGTRSCRHLSCLLHVF